MADSVAEAARLPPSEALAFFRQKLNVPTTHWTNLWQAAHARGFMVAGAADLALVKDFRIAVDKAIAGKVTIQEFRKEFDAIVARHGWAHNGSPGWRSDLIFNVNVSMANAAGRYARMTTPEALEMYPYWMYRHNACPHPRPLHLAWDGTLLPANDPWFDTHFAPNGWRCHCEIVPVSRWMMRKRGWSVSERPALDLRPWRNPRTGQVIEVPAGIDPGFAYNPGKAWLSGRHPTSGRQFAQAGFLPRQMPDPHSPRRG
ncbi:phage minor head protein [Komagataeibacter kakiaceti JCM 25156]